MTAVTTSTTTDAPLPSTPGLGGSLLTRINWFDGLFLRAVHLHRMQDHARQLSHLLARSGGPGVVHGFTLHLEGGKLGVNPGLAFDPRGQPLVLESTATLDVAELIDAAGGNQAGTGLWVVELVAAEWAFGDEKVFGLLCDDPCAGGATTKPYLAEGLTVRVRPDALALGQDGSRRSAVATAWFERERSEPHPLLATSDHDPVTLTRLGSELWATGTDLVAGEGVPIGVLLRDASGGWDLDVWVARRDRMDSPPRRAWQVRMGQRPWDVFLAQVLQFQSHLAEVLPGLGGSDPAAARRLEAIARFLAPPPAAALLQPPEGPLELPGAQVPGTAAELPGNGLPPDAWTPAGLEVLATRAAGGLRAAGFVDLPPWGLLPIDPAQSVEDQVRAMFPANFPLRFCTCRADAVAHTAEEAQHLDRIGLQEPYPQVDIVVPLDRGALPSERITTAHLWVAFHRRRDVTCSSPEPTVDDVPVFTVAALDGFDIVMKSLVGGEAIDVTEVGSVSFPTGSPELAAPPPAGVVQAFANLAAVQVVAFAGLDAGVPLALGRAERVVKEIQPSPLPGAIEAFATTGSTRVGIYVLTQPAPNVVVVPAPQAEAARATKRKATGARRAAKKPPASG